MCRKTTPERTDSDREVVIRTVVHLSDFHFGNAFEYLLDPLVDTVKQLAPDLVILSGDFVEHASRAEFEQAREYLTRLPMPQLAVPGNHDLPFYDPLKRYRVRLSRYRRYITDDLNPVYADDEMIVAGVSTPRVIPMKGGRINAKQVAHIEKTMSDQSGRVKVLVTHHPLDLPENFRKRQLVGHAGTAVEKLSCSVDLMLAGHIHLSSTGATATRYKSTGHSVIFAQAGTAISKRNKGEPNSFNVIQLRKDCIDIQHYSWNEKASGYRPCQWEHFEHGKHGWSKLVDRKKEEQVQR